VDLCKTIKIIYDPIKGEIDYETDNKMTFAEALGAIEYVKMMITRTFIDETRD
jgi:hypothetical protein